jgi:hypothetical protein
MPICHTALGMPALQQPLDHLGFDPVVGMRNANQLFSSIHAHCRNSERLDRRGKATYLRLNF